MNTEQVYEHIKKEYGGLISPLHQAVMLYEVEEFRAALRSTLNLNVATLIAETCRFFNLTNDMLLSPSRKREVVYPRHMIMWMLRHQVVENSLSYHAIGALLGERDHATVLHGVQNIDNLIEVDAQVRDNLMMLINRFGLNATWDPNRKRLSFFHPKAA